MFPVVARVFLPAVEYFDGVELSTSVSSGAGCVSYANLLQKTFQILSFNESGSKDAAAGDHLKPDNESEFALRSELFTTTSKGFPL